MPSSRPPVFLDAVFGDPQLVRRLAERHAPYFPVQRYFGSFAEQTSVSGNDASQTADPGAWTTYVAPFFRADWAFDRPLVDGIDAVFHNPAFHDAACRLFDATIVRPHIVYANLMLPMPEYDLGHLDVPEFRGVDRHAHPIWLLSAMGRSGLFERWRIHIATAVTWDFDGVGGGFTYWLDGPDAAPTTIPPARNTAIVGDNDRMFHRGDGVGGPDVAWLMGLTRDSHLVFAGGDGWEVREGDATLARIDWPHLRVSVSWKAFVLRDDAERRLVDEHRDDLRLEQVVAMFLDDLAATGRPIAPPVDPLRDPAFVAAVNAAYVRVPSVYPAR